MTKEDLELDLGKISFSKEKITNFFKKYGVFLLVLIPVLLAAYLRLIPSTMPITDDWAKSTVDSYYKNQLGNQIREQYPNLPNENLQALVDQQYSDFQKQNKAMIQEQIKAASNQIKSSFQDENGYIYMPDIDPYAYLRYARNYIEKGHVGDEVRNGTQWDTHMVAPKGKAATSSPHPIILAYLHKIMKFFNSKITLMQSSNYFPVILAALSVIPIFFAAKFFAGNIGGFFAALMMAINGAFLGRTTWGHPDTDVYAIFFAAYFIWFFFLAVKEKEIKKTAVYYALAGLTIGLFSLFWTGWWYVLAFVLGTAMIYLLYLIYENKAYSIKIIKQNKDIKQFAISALLLILVSGVFVSLLNSPQTFVNSVKQPFVFTSLKQASHETLWPNVYTTVAELNQASFKTIINSIGGNLFFYFSIIGILLLLFTKIENKRPYVHYAILIIIWYIGIIYASTKGIRFSMMLVPPLSLAIAAAIGILNKKIADYLERLNISKKISSAIFIAVILLFFLLYIKESAASVRNDIPIMNDAWYDSLNKIKLESQPDAIINSWWDFGHHFKYVADRAVTFDGASQNTPMAHWIGKVLLTNNEKEAIGILKMLDCGSNDAFEILDSEINDISVSVKMLYDVVVLDKTGAESYLASKGIKKETIDKVLQNTHCNPPEDYFITSEDMVGKGAVWAHFGSWNFDKADMWVEGRKLSKDEFTDRFSKQLSISQDEAKKLYFEVKAITNENNANSWIAPWPGYVDQLSCSKKDNKLICGGALIDIDTKDVQINTDKGVIKPNSLIYSENGDFVEKEFEGDLAGQSILLLKNGNSYRMEIVSPQLGGSMFTRLFYYDGAGTAQFEKFSDLTTINGERIIVWKIKW